MNILLYRVIFLSFIALTFLDAKINCVVSIAPQKVFVEAIGGDLVDVSLMVKAGNSPHTYEPKPSQMKDIAKADIYFSIGVEFEKVWLKRFKHQNREMKIIDISKNIQKIDIDRYKNKQKSSSQHIKKDPHIWTSPINVKQIVRNIYNSLIQFDNKNRVIYKKNLDTFIKKIDLTDKTIRDNLKNLPKTRKFIVFHPALGYFAKEYNLIQLAIEVEGKNPKPKALRFLINEIKRDKIRVIFTQPEFSPRVANQLAKSLNIKVMKFTSLAENWSDNLIDLSKVIKWTNQ